MNLGLSEDNNLNFASKNIAVNKKILLGWGQKRIK